MQNTWILANLIALATFSQLAQSGETKPHELDTLIISAPLHKQSAETALPVNILSGNTLRQKAASTIGKTLEAEPGINNSSFGPGVGLPVIRGQGGARVRVMQDGIGSQDVSTISADHASSAEPLLAERIEVLRGPATLLYGNGAIGGVVNVIDNRIPDEMPPKLIGGAIEQRFDTVSDEKATVFKLEGGKNVFAWHLDGFYRDRNNVNIPGSAIDESAIPETDPDGLERNSGSIANSNARAKSATAGFSIIGEQGFTGLAINHLENNYGIPPSTDGETEQVRIDAQRTRYDFKTELKNPFAFLETLRARLGYTDYRHFELENGGKGTEFSNKATEGRLELVHAPLIAQNHGVFGLQINHRKFAAIGEEAFVPRSEIDSYGLFAIEDFHFNDWTIEAGLRVEQQEINPDALESESHLTVTSSASLTWQFIENNSLTLAFTRSQRAPTIEELFADGPHLATRNFELGDAGLDPETAYNIDLGLNTDLNWIRGTFNLFYNWVDEYLFLRNTGAFFSEDDDAFLSACPENNACLPVFQHDQQNAIFKGFEAQVTLPLVSSKWGDLDMTFFGDYVRGKFRDGGDVPRLPPLRYGFQLDYFFDNWSANLRITRAARHDKPGDDETPTDSYLLLNTSVNYQLTITDNIQLLAFVKGNNLLDEEIRNSTSFLRNIAPEPGRGAEFGLRVNF